MDLMEPTRVSGFLTQGRFEVDEFVHNYWVEYSDDGVSWTTFLNTLSAYPDYASGHADRHTWVEAGVPWTGVLFVARYVRLHPLEWAGSSELSLKAGLRVCESSNASAASLLA